MRKLLLRSLIELSIWMQRPPFFDQSVSASQTCKRLLSVCLILTLVASACTVTSAGPARPPSNAPASLTPGTTVVTTTTVVTQTTRTISTSGEITDTASLTSTGVPVVLPTPTSAATNTIPITETLAPAPADAITTTSLLTGSAALSASIPVTAATANLVQLISATPGLETLAAALTSSGMANALQGPGPFTLFAPTDEAFTMLPPGQLQALLNSPATLVSVLQYHLVIDEVTSSELASLGVALSSTGQPITVTVQTDGSLTVNGARILQGDIHAANGIVHIIDRVLLPPTQ